MMGELRSIADDDDLHPADAESGVGMFASFYQSGDHCLHSLFCICSQFNELTYLISLRSMSCEIVTC